MFGLLFHINFIIIVFVCYIDLYLYVILLQSHLLNMISLLNPPVVYHQYLQTNQTPLLYTIKVSSDTELKNDSYKTNKKDKSFYVFLHDMFVRI